MKARGMGVTLRGDRNQCAGCGELFNSTSAFDRHRAGDFGTLADARSHRFCLSVGEMEAKGMSRNRDGFWIERRRQMSSAVADGDARSGSALAVDDPGAGGVERSSRTHTSEPEDDR